ncbi:MAG: helix-turn-helix transcriptional regulator [Spirochaetes bacterium]|nr:helix-turn-helix transcriptional regulator [Spirochaetota bacterium]
MSEQLMNTKEVAEYLDINEKQVYALIKSKKIPCTKATGKWLFPRELIDRWILGDSAKELSAGRITEIEKNSSFLASGSNDPVLEVLLNYMKKSHPGLNIFSSSTGSTEGLRLLKEGLIDIAWCHLFDPQSGRYNIPFISSSFSEMDVTVVHLFYRELGFVYTWDREISTFDDLSKKGVVIVNRQKGSGTRMLLDYNLDRTGIPGDSITGYQNEVYTHFEVGLSLASGEATAGIATKAIASVFSLGFHPILVESFDMVLQQPTFFKKCVQAFIETLNSQEFRTRVKSLGNYDFMESGKIIFPES